MFCHFYFLLLVLLTVELVSFATTTVVLWCVILSQAGASDFQHNKNTYFPVNYHWWFPFPLLFRLSWCYLFSGLFPFFCSIVSSWSPCIWCFSHRLCLLHILNGLFAPLFAIYQFLGREFVFFDFTLPLHVCKWFYDAEWRMAEGVESWWHAVKSMQQTSIVIKENRCYSLLRC